mgnify:FL=1
MSEPVIEVRHLSKSFGTHVVLRDVDFTVNAGDVTCIIGASGSGKSTLLRCINLLETPTNGKVLFHGSDITAKGSDPCAYRAKVGMVFQSFNLFNNMTVLDNCTAGLRYVLHQDKETSKKTALENLEKVGMAPTSTPSRASFPAARSSALRLPAPWRCSPRCCCLTSRRPPLTRRWSVKSLPSCASWPKRA